MKKNKGVLLLTLLALGMFGFAFALVPMYNKMCKALGINGKPNLALTAERAASRGVDESRTVVVQFLANQSATLPWAFYPEVKQVRVHPGEVAKLSFYAENKSDHEMTVQAIPSVTPGTAAKHIKKTECFCFAKQTLDAHEAMHMPLHFHLDKDLPSNIHTMTLSYTLFDVTDKGTR